MFVVRFVSAQFSFPGLLQQKPCEAELIRKLKDIDEINEAMHFCSFEAFKNCKEHWQILFNSFGGQMC